MSNSVAVPFFFNPELDPDFNKSAQRGLAYPMFLSFASLATQRFSKNLADIGLDAVQGLYVDNSTSPAPTTIVISGTLQTIVVPPFTQGYYRPLVQNQQLDFSATNYATTTNAGTPNTIGLHWLSILPDTAMVWSTNNSPGENWMSTYATANATCTAAIPSVPGRSTYISTVVFSSAGATSSAALYCTINNVDSAGSGATLYYIFGIPAGPTIAAQPLILTFSPPILIVPNGIFSATMPAAGAGNTMQAVSVTGFIV